MTTNPLLQQHSGGFVEMVVGDRHLCNLSQDEENHADFIALMNNIGNADNVKQILGRIAERNSIFNELCEKLILNCFLLASKNGQPDVFKLLLFHQPFFGVKNYDSFLSASLILAGQYDRTKIIELLLKYTHGIDIDVYDSSGKTALVVAAEYGHLECVKLLYNGNADINKVDLKDKYTPLMWASKNGHDKIVEFLISRKANLNSTGGWNESTALMKASENGHVEAVKVLSQKGAELNLQNGFKSTALMLASERGHVEVADHLASVMKAAMNRQNEYGYTALILAAENGHSKILKVLCDNKAELDIPNKFGKTAFIMAAEFGHLKAVRILYEAGANINFTSKILKTALMLAAVNKHVEIVKYLVEKGAKKDIVNKDGGTALMMGCAGGSTEIVRCLLHDQKDQIITSNKAGNNSVMIAAESGHVEIVKLLLETWGLPMAMLHTYEDGILNAINNEKSTALILAATNGHLEVTLYLVEESGGSGRGSDLEYANQSGLTSIAALTKYYKKHSDQFLTFIEYACKYSSLLEELRFILPAFESPNEILNKTFAQLLLGIKEHTPSNELIQALIHVACTLKLCVESHPLESLDTLDRLSSVEAMILEAMASDAMDKQEYIVLVLQSRQNNIKIGIEDEELSRARSFLSGPLAHCLEYDLLTLLGTDQISTYVEKVFLTFLRRDRVRNVHYFRDFFQMRSNCIHLRTCPAVMLYLEGISKLIILILTCILSDGVYVLPLSESRSEVAVGFGVYESALLVMLVSGLLHEVGEFADSNWSITTYFDEIWNYLDLSSLGLVLGWAILEGMNQHDTARVLLTVAAIPMCLGLLRYLSRFKYVGILVLTIFAMCVDLSNFLLVFIMCCMGFGMAFMGLYSDVDEFSSVTMTFKTLFDAATGGHDFSIFNDHEVPFVGQLLMLIFVLFTVLMLINLVIARMSSTIEKIDDTSMQTWCMMKARRVQENLLINEFPPLSMLPPPLNLVPVALSPLHYYVIWQRRQLAEDKDGRKLVLSVSGTASDMVLSLFALVPSVFVEMYLCLRDINSMVKIPLTSIYQINTPWEFYFYLLMFVFLSPLIIFSFIIMLLMKTFGIRSILNLHESNASPELYYNNYSSSHIKKFSQIEYPENLNNDTHITLNVKCLRGGITDYPKTLFSKSSLFATLELGPQVLQTQICEVMNLHTDEAMWFESKAFYIPKHEINDKLKSKITLWEKGYSVEDKVIGIREEPITTWIANGRFEGIIDLFDKDNKNIKTGKIAVAVKLIPPKNASKLNLKSSLSIHNTLPVTASVAESSLPSSTSMTGTTAISTARVFTPLSTLSSEADDAQEKSVDSVPKPSHPTLKSLASTRFPKLNLLRSLSSYQFVDSNDYDNDNDSETEHTSTSMTNTKKTNKAVVNAFNVINSIKYIKSKMLFSEEDRDRIFSTIRMDDKGKPMFLKDSEVPFYELKSELKSYLLDIEKKFNEKINKFITK